ncbi:MAG: EscU/YscU/HrcU family type III secretion system export apparatus switch protein [Firmicutes bacterium]|nr:EscU/YscU/HrcU family type III secretion system export apparatus switch protein [Bacillota bacterium]
MITGMGLLHDFPAAGIWLAQSGGEKSHAATPRKKQQAQEKGMMWHSPDFQAAVVLIVAYAVLKWQLPAVGAVLMHLETEVLTLSFAPGIPSTIFSAVTLSFHLALSVILRLALPLTIAGLVVAIAQAGWHPGFNRLAPDFKRINPIAGLQRMFSMDSVWILVKGLLKILVIGGAVVWAISRDFDKYPGLIDQPLGVALSQSEEFFTQVLLAASGAFFIAGLLDMGYQVQSYRKKLRMTTQEVRDELKETEGNPEVKRKQRQFARKLARTGMGQVKNAQVIVTNPTHFAVALKWDAARMAAPVVIAKGQDSVALAMREIAYEHEIPVVENPPLARSLYADVPLGKEILQAHYQAVADILSFIMKRRVGGNR